MSADNYSPGTGAAAYGGLMILLAGVVLMGVVVPLSTQEGTVRYGMNPFEPHVYTITKRKDGYVRFTDENGISDSSVDDWMFFSTSRWPINYLNAPSQPSAAPSPPRP